MEVSLSGCIRSVPAFLTQLMTHSCMENFQGRFFPGIGRIEYDVRRMNDGSAKSVVRRHIVLLMLTLTVTAIWFGITILDIWSTTFDVVSERFDAILVLRMNAGLAALMLASFGLLWARHRRTASSLTLLEFFFGVCFASFLFVVISSGVPAVFSG